MEEEKECKKRIVKKDCTSCMDTELCCPDHCCDWDSCECNDCPMCAPKGETKESIKIEENIKEEHRVREEKDDDSVASSSISPEKKSNGDAAAYVLNGVETNIAAGSGVRGIRWLKKNDQFSM